MMQFKSFLAIFALTVAAACSGSGGVEGGGPIQIGDHLIGWNDVLAPNSQLRTLHPNVVAGLGPGESVYLFSAEPTNSVTQANTQPSVRLSNGSVFYGTVKECSAYLITFGGKKPRQKDVDLYNECREKAASIPQTRRAAPMPKSLSRSALIALAKQGVQAQGRCQWLGYDAALDAQMRAGGLLASASDNRLFFAKLRCA